jgi:hypothetical protein
MTTLEFSNEFDISYNGIASNSAPAIDMYEKSVYFTKAQLEIVKDRFDPKGNKYGKGFEQSSKRRQDLNELIRHNTATIQVVSSDGIDDNSTFMRIPNDTFLIIQEKIKISSSDTCVDGTEIKVVPKTHDEYNTQIDNPFKEPSIDVAWRMDYYSQTGNNKNVEIITPYDISTYRMRYVKYPEPIILTNLLTAFPGESLTIDNVALEQTCKLSEGIHREILDRAVELATADLIQDNLNAKLQINKRTE